MLSEAASRSGPVTVSWLPGYEPKDSPFYNPSGRTKFPFQATINGMICTVWPDWIEYEMDSLHSPFDDVES